MSHCEAIAERPLTVRSRITNGSRLLAGIDGRTADARRFRDLAQNLADDLGGAAALTEAQRALVRHAAGMIVRSEQLQSAVLRGEVVDNEQLTRLANASTRILSKLGLKRGAERETPEQARARLFGKPKQAIA